MSTNNGGPAFPVHFNTAPRDGMGGMTLRDYFAAKAMEGMLANPNKDGGKCGAAGLQFFPKYAYEWADAMLEARQL